ncbi:MAG: hypothetical protein FWD47_02875 [Treponema sp.]|nr:hypothetical protein [Treponema sp.]
MSKKFNVHPAVMAVWAAVVASGYLIPTFPILGGGSFSFANILNPLSGILFGPIIGALCSAVGGFIGSIIAPHTAWIGFGTFIPGTVTAFVTGCIAWGKWPPVSIREDGNFVFNGAIIVYIIGTILWFTQEIGRNVILYPVIVYGSGFIIAITAILFARQMYKTKERIFNFIALWLFAYGGLIAGATIGNFFSLVIRKTPADIWVGLIIISPIERMIFALGAALVGVPLLAGLRKIGIKAGLQIEDDEINNES